MPQVKLRDKGQVNILSEILQEWSRNNHVSTNDAIEVTLVNGVLMLIPKKRHTTKRDMMSFAGIGKGVWGDTPEAVDETLSHMRASWTS